MCKRKNTVSHKDILQQHLSFLHNSQKNSFLYETFCANINVLKYAQKIILNFLKILKLFFEQDMDFHGATLFRHNSHREMARGALCNGTAQSSYELGPTSSLGLIEQ